MHMILKQMLHGNYLTLSTSMNEQRAITVCAPCI